jgi:glycosyltransferase involved in cell wall biosynthesis
VIDGKGGHLVQPGDPSMLASALSSALQHAPAMGAFNRERVEACYSLVRVAERIEQTYEAVLGEKERARVAS